MNSDNYTETTTLSYGIQGLMTGKITVSITLKYPMGAAHKMRKTLNELPFFDDIEGRYIRPAFQVLGIGYSVVVPTYNDDKFIRACVDSSLNQTLKSIEVYR